jgi:protein-L-isoaspartate(D-aspartate) O-methyltransferase
MFSRGEHNLGHLCRKEYGAVAYAIGFGTYGGTVAAASDWDGPMEIKTIVPALAQSYEGICHETGVASFLLDLHQSSLNGADGLRKPRLERAIGVIYRPETELASHYFQAVLPDQFNEYVWLDRTTPIAPFETKELQGLPDTYPFGL